MAAAGGEAGGDGGSMRIDGEQVILSTGKTFSANMGILGIRRGDDYSSEEVKENVLIISEGADFPLNIELTKSEKQEISEHMAALWIEWGK